MIYDIKITDQADNDIRSIYEYIAYELQSPGNANGQLERIEKCIMNLDQMPERYRFYDKEPWKSRGLHIVPVDNYCVLYIVNNSDMTVSIMRVMYGGRDIGTQLAMKNTRYNSEGKAVAEKDDEWRDETEWVDIFEQMKKERKQLSEPTG